MFDQILHQFKFQKYGIPLFKGTFTDVWEKLPINCLRKIYCIQDQYNLIHYSNSI